jgi:hypothetical protein
MIGRNVKLYCHDDAKMIENYELALKDEKKIWDCHHKLETHFSDGVARPLKCQLSQKELIALGTFYHRPSVELIFLSRKEHHKIHYPFGFSKDLKRTDEWKKKIAESMLGKNKGRKHTELSKLHMSEAAKKRSPVTQETREKLSNAGKGRKHTEETKRKLSEARKRYLRNKKLEVI